MSSSATDNAVVMENALALLARLEARVGFLEKGGVALGGASAPAQAPASANASASTNANANVEEELARLREVVQRQEYRIATLVRSLKEADAKIVALGGKVE